MEIEIVWSDLLPNKTSFETALEHHEALVPGDNQGW
jgi:hypothetical protein